jgi:hypothetical protein
MDTHDRFSNGQKSGLRILREIVSAENRADNVSAVAAESGCGAGQNLSLRVVCLDFNDVVGM